MQAESSSGLGHQPSLVKQAPALTRGLKTQPRVLSPGLLPMTFEKQLVLLTQESGEGRGKGSMSTRALAGCGGECGAQEIALSYSQGITSSSRHALDLLIVVSSSQLGQALWGATRKEDEGCPGRLCSRRST